MLKNKARTFIAALSCLFLFSGCSLYKKVFKSERHEKTTEREQTRERDSVAVIWKTLPTETIWTFNVGDLVKAGDFSKVVNVGKGNETSIVKKDSTITLVTKTAEQTSSDTKVKVDEKKETTIIDEKETVSKKHSRTLPWWFWLLVTGLVLFAARKYIAKIIAIFSPNVAAAQGVNQLIKKVVGMFKK